jgi:hypothetical protein
VTHTGSSSEAPEVTATSTVAEESAGDETAGTDASGSDLPSGPADGDECHCAGSSAAQFGPATQVEDMELEDEEHRPSSPVAFSDLDDDPSCTLCHEDESPRAFDFLDGSYCCEGCLDDESHADRVTEERDEVMRAREAAARQPRPQPPQQPPRRSERVSRLPVPIYNLERSGPGQPGWSSYDLGRLDSRHDRVRAETYSEVEATRDKLRADVEAARRENGTLVSELDRVFGRLRELATPWATVETDEIDFDLPAAVLLREAIMELVQLSERAESAGASEEAAEQEEEEPEPSGVAAITPPWQSAPVRMGGVDGTRGDLAIDAAYLAWGPTDGSDDEPWQQHELSDVLYAEIDDSDEV